MDNKSTLEKLIQDKTIVIQKVISKYLGVDNKELNQDISSCINYPFEINVNTKIPFKQSKKIFIKSYIENILVKNKGQIIRSANEAKINRRTIYRYINEFKIDVEEIRLFSTKNNISTKQYKDFYHIVENTVKKYDELIHPIKQELFEKRLPKAAEDLTKIIPKLILPLKEAVEMFEVKYIQQALLDNNSNIEKTSKEINVSTKTIQRKIKLIEKNKVII